jgi:hypothetical protein
MARTELSKAVNSGEHANSEQTARASAVLEMLKLQNQCGGIYRVARLDDRVMGQQRRFNGRFALATADFTLQY